MARVAPLARELQSISDLEERRRRLGKLEAQALESLVNEELINQEAIKSKLEVTDKQVQLAIADTMARNNLDEAQFKEALKAQGDTLSSYRRSIRKQILRLRAINTFVRPRVTISDDDIKAQYERVNRRNAGVSRVKLHQVLIKLDAKAPPSDKKAAQKKATKVVELSQAGKAFSELAATYSDDENTKATGGGLGWIERNSLPSEWETIVFAMSKGEVRGPIESPQGLHVFHVSEVERGTQKPLSEMKEQLRNELFRTELDRQTLLWIDELKKKFHVKTKL